MASVWKGHWSWETSGEENEYGLNVLCGILKELIKVRKDSLLKVG